MLSFAVSSGRIEVERLSVALDSSRARGVHARLQGMTDASVVRGIVGERGDVVVDLIGAHSIQVGMLDDLDVPSVELHADTELRDPKYARLNQDDEILSPKLRERRLDGFGCQRVERNDPRLGKALAVGAHEQS